MATARDINVISTVHGFEKNHITIIVVGNNIRIFFVDI